MGNIGRFACVSVPFMLTIGSLVCILIVSLAGVTNKSLYLMKVNTANLSISKTDAASLVTRSLPADLHLRSLSGLVESALDPTSTSVGVTSSSGNITASTLDLADSYKIDIFTYCSTTGTSTNCTSAHYNWAANATNTTAFSDLALSAAGVSISLPDAITSALKTFSKVSYITQIVYTIAGVLTILEIVIGLFALCSRIGSCCTFIVSGLQTVAIISASILATVLASITTGAIDAAAKTYGVTASINTSFLATTWIGVAFSLASGLFWMFSICCCKGGDRKDRSGRGESRFRDSHQEPLVPGPAAPFGGNGYQRVHDPYAPQETGNTAYGGYQVPMTQVKNGRQTTGAYEPYTHGAV